MIFLKCPNSQTFGKILNIFFPPNSFTITIENLLFLFWKQIKSSVDFLVLKLPTTIINKGVIHQRYYSFQFIVTSLELVNFTYHLFTSDTWHFWNHIHQLYRNLIVYFHFSIVNWSVLLVLQWHGTNFPIETEVFAVFSKVPIVFTYGNWVHFACTAVVDVDAAIATCCVCWWNNNAISNYINRNHIENNV